MNKLQSPEQVLEIIEGYLHANYSEVHLQHPAEGKYKAFDEMKDQDRLSTSIYNTGGGVYAVILYGDLSCCKNKLYTMRMNGEAVCKNTLIVLVNESIKSKEV